MSQFSKEAPARIKQHLQGTKGSRNKIHWRIYSQVQIICRIHRPEHAGIAEQVSSRLACSSVSGGGGFNAEPARAVTETLGGGSE